VVVVWSWPVPSVSTHAGRTRNQTGGRLLGVSRPASDVDRHDQAATCASQRFALASIASFDPTSDRATAFARELGRSRPSPKTHQGMRRRLRWSTTLHLGSALAPRRSRYRAHRDDAATRTLRIRAIRVVIYALRA
jgi:hypothetical protein